MNIRENIKKIFSLRFGFNILCVLLLGVFSVLAIVYGADIYTNHGEKLKLPDVRRHNIEDARRVLDNLGVDIEIADTGYVKTLPPGTVLEQTPAGGSVVKPGRIVYLVINAIETPRRAIPEIIDNSSYREAEARLKGVGFLVAQPELIEGEKDWVYGVKVRGRSIQNGTMVSIEDSVTLVIGRGAAVQEIPVFQQGFDDGPAEEVDEFEDAEIIL